MKSETAKKILSETPKETIDKVRETANKLVMKNKKEPLMSAEEFYKTNNSDLSSDIEYNIEQYAKYYTQWHLNNAKEFVADEAKVKPSMPMHVGDIDKQSIHTAIDNYIKDNL